jgi:hypothetical protein
MRLADTDVDADVDADDRMPTHVIKSVWLVVIVGAITEAPPDMASFAGRAFASSATALGEWKVTAAVTAVAVLLLFSLSMLCDDLDILPLS